MKLHPLILQDHYRRWWWAHLVAFLLFGAIGVAVGCVVNLDPHWIPLGAGVFLGAVTLAVAPNAQTNARTLLSLPVRKSELGTSFWWIAVPLSALAPTAGLALGWTVSGLFGGTVLVEVPVLLRFLLLTQSLSAFQFTVLCFIPNADTSNPREKILLGFTGVFWWIGLIAGSFVSLSWSESHALWDPLSCGILAMGVICGLVSWHRRTAFLLQRARKNEGPTQSVRSTVVLPKPSRLDGFAGLYIQTVLRMAGIGFASSAVAGGTLAWLGGEMVSMRIGDFWVGPSAVMIVACLRSLRHWRTLPISVERMSWLMIRLLLTGYCALMLPLIAMQWLASQPLVWSDLGLMMLAGGLFAVLFAFALRFGINWLLLPFLLVSITQPMLSPILGRFFEQGGEHPATAASALTGVILLFFAQTWIVRSLRHQSRIFSPGFHQFGRLNTSA
jgi:hypothetical protein